MKQNQDKKFLLLFEAAKRSLLMADIIFNRINSEILKLEPLIDQSLQVGDKAATILIDCVAFIDFSHRFGEVVDQLPLINKKMFQIVALKKKLYKVGIVRNHLQHLRGDLSKNIPIRFPILGYFKWVNNQTCYIIAMSQPFEQDFTSIVYDTELKKWVGKMQYSIM